MARGRSDILFYISLICTPLAVGSYLIGVQWGVTGVAAALFVVTVITDIPNFYIVFRILRPGLFSQFLRSIAPPTLLACFMAVVLFGCQKFFRPQFGTALAHLAFLAPVGVLTYAAGAFIFMRQSVHDALRLVRLR